MKINRQKVDCEYYSDLSRLNKSMLSIFAKSPAEYHRQMENPVKLDSYALRQGTMIHKYILEYEDFWNEFYKQETQSPTKSVNQKKFAEELVANNFIPDDYDKAIKAYKNAYATDKLSDAKLNDAMTDAVREVKEWVAETLSNEGKVPCTSADQERLQKYMQAVRKHKGAAMLLKDSTKDYSVNSIGDIVYGDTYAFSEFQINWESPQGISCKSLIDRIVFKTVEKRIWLIDLKTTSDISNFQHSFEEYTYGMQLAFYTDAIRWFLINEMGENPDDWSIEQYIIAVQKDNSDVKVFQFSDRMIEGYEMQIRVLMNDLIWHQANNIWNMTRIEYCNKGCCPIDLYWQ